MLVGLSGAIALAMGSVAFAQEMVKDPSTGKMIKAPQYGGQIVFAEDNEPSLLGAVTPEEAGLAVVTVNGRTHSYNSSPGFQYPIHGFSFHRGSPHTRAAPM